MSQRFDVPDELAFLEAFGLEPLESAPHDGYWCYRFSSEAGAAVRLSFNTHERSLQTACELGGQASSTVSCEGAVSLRISENGDSLRGECRFADAVTTLVLQVAPQIEVNWSTLVE